MITKVYQPEQKNSSFVENVSDTNLVSLFHFIVAHLRGI